MFVNVAVYRIHPQHIEAFKRRMLQHAETCLRDEKNCLRFDVNQSTTDPALFLMYEVFRSAEDLRAHASAPHTQDFQKTRDENGWLADRTVYQLNALFPLK
jgi:quinol monooxygenase YgiN